MYCNHDTQHEVFIESKIWFSIALLSVPGWCIYISTVSKKSDWKCPWLQWTYIQLVYVSLRTDFQYLILTIPIHKPTMKTVIRQGCLQLGQRAAKKMAQEEVLPQKFPIFPLYRILVYVPPRNPSNEVKFSRQSCTQVIITKEISRSDQGVTDKGK